MTWTHIYQKIKLRGEVKNWLALNVADGPIGSIAPRELPS